MANDFLPKLRIAAVLRGVVTSDVFDATFKKKVGDNFVDDAKGFVYNVEIPLDGAPPITLQLQTLDKPEKGDTIEFPMKLETSLRSKYSIKDQCVIIAGKHKKPSPPSAA